MSRRVILAGLSTCVHALKSVFRPSVSRHIVRTVGLLFALGFSMVLDGQMPARAQGGGGPIPGGGAVGVGPGRLEELFADRRYCWRIEEIDFETKSGEPIWRPNTKAPNRPTSNDHNFDDLSFEGGTVIEDGESVIITNPSQYHRAVRYRCPPPPPAKRRAATESDKYDSDLFYRLRRGERKEPEEERVEIGCFGRPTSVQLCSFTGPFIGAQVVGSWSRVGTMEFLASTGTQTNQFSDSGSGFGGGINGGYNWQPWSNIVIVGVVFDANFLNDMVQHNFAGGNYIGSVVNFTASAQARAGVLATPSLLLYGQTGLSIANQQLKIDFGGPETNESKTTPGFTFGGGAEWMLPRNIVPMFGRSTSLFLDYKHTWWNKATLNMPVASPFFNYTWKRESDLVSLGARFRF